MKFKIIYCCIQYVFIVVFVGNYVQICSSFKLTVLHNNDFHSHFEPIDTYGSKCKTGDECFGGVARTVSKVFIKT